MSDKRELPIVAAAKFSERQSSVVGIANLILIAVNIAVVAVFAAIYQFSPGDLFVFSAFVVLLVILPGGLAVSSLSLPGATVKSKFVLANAIGLSGLCYFSWLLNAKFRLPYYSGVYMIVALSLFFLWNRMTRLQHGEWRVSGLLQRILNLIRSSELSVLLAIALLAILVSNGLAKNATVHGGELCFYGTAGVEGIWHLGNAAYMKKDFDFGDIHQNGFKFTYHFFIYIFAALASNLCSLNTDIVFFKFLPIYTFFFLLYSGYVSGSTLFRSRKMGLLAALLALFMDDASIAVKLGQTLHLASLDYLFLGPKITSAYLSSPSYSAAFIVFFPLLPLIRNDDSHLRGDRHGAAAIVTAGFLIGTISGFKVSTFLVLGLALMILAAIEILRRRTFIYTAMGAFALAISSPFLMALQQTSLASLRFNPALFPLASPLGRELLHLSETPFLPFLVVAGILIIYLPVEFGPRLLSLRYLPGDLQRRADGISLLWLCGIVGVLLTLLITPSLDAYNAMYFHRFGAVCLSFLMARTLAHLFDHKRVSAILIAGLCLFYVAGGLYTFFRLRSEVTLKVPQDKIAGLQKLITARDNDFKVIMSNRFKYSEEGREENIFYLYSAFSENMVLSEGERFSIIRVADSLALKRVREDIAQFYSTDDSQTARAILERWSVDYVLVDLEYGQTLHFDPSFLEQVHASKNLIIYAFRRNVLRT
ncbi:MAG: hypothetical protein ONB48_15795 [candidate division KSB1 bacterium]|nr:hypothetical protein [candidate division KSB1 bacterium]MDZ7276110.1 hypothetical protein [candidate division KSB1 bacterium]MDZ7287110.1 hypothetical protein [candidate division KSB1 bacterium]MDZ7296965.1 hypothetical protein [candidate division KSB1 bacterium]MDZ7306206.1 hypothetical protein [candidate division KSB1 bacterium]